MKDFIVLDTEGKDLLKEIAVIDSQGKLIYEAFSQENLDNYDIKFNRKPLKEILNDFSQLSHNKLIIGHHISCDLKVLQNSYIKFGIDWVASDFNCSLELAKNCFPNFPSYSLEYLSKKLELKVNNSYFNSKKAHNARYDAQFTYQLYRKILAKKAMTSYTINPFGSNRVDNPFQDHVDLSSIYQDEYRILESIIEDIKYDKNHQSKGAIIIGEPGSGKTHLIMRLAKNRLKFNRLLFIRCPNNSQAVLYHIYSRILESFVHEVPGTKYSQIEHLLAHSFVKLISHNTFMNLNQKDLYIIECVKENSLDLYEKLGAEDSSKKIGYWQHIEKRTNEWWFNEYGLSGYAPQIIKGIVKFCSYQERKRKELVTRWLAAESLAKEDLELIGLEDWSEEISKEDFSLQAISVFSKLSLLDEPLIIVFDQLESLGLRPNETILFRFGEAVKEIFTHVPNSLIILNLFPDRWQQFQEKIDRAMIDRSSQHQIYLKSPNDQELKGILELRSQDEGIDLTELFTSEEIKDIVDQTSIRAMLNRASDYYRFKVNNIPLPEPINSNENKQNYQSFSLETRVIRIENQLSELQKLFKQLGGFFDNHESFIITNDVASPDIIPSVLESKKSTNSPSKVIKTEVIPTVIDIKDSPIINTIKDRLQEFLEKNKAILNQEYQKLQIISESDDIGKLMGILVAFKPVLNLEIDHLLLGNRKVPDHCLIEKDSKKVFIGFLHSDGAAFTSRIKNCNELVVTNKIIQFQLWRDARQTAISGKGGNNQIDMLNNSANGKFCIMEKEDRIQFELIYKVITDIQNRDLEIELEQALRFLLSEMTESWLIKTLL
ncbi:exonuclease domain-containing protein [Crocosphaera sp. UHCC 0190]|uniref:exonuclease domain-containing protein n=1 Tax=Crocosphaera sp. UHCC 0190 TaxID=3110246 RepID=UPI002B20EE76|nr:exonuclease domain-containing protein [Crocosphaera sp. UHCC 0190]MEA5512353.1 exonuclease domain-containing protein [Crocosphaera sp. UHCC 0190]